MKTELGAFVNDPRPVFEDALAAINCSNNESFSLTCQEASAHGLPVIATRCGGPEEIVDDGKTGFLIDIADSATLADRMRRLLDDPGLARAMGSAGARLVRNRFGKEEFRQRTANLLDL